MLRILQYIFWPFSFRNPPAIFWRFFTFLRSLSDILSSKGTSKRFKNRRWFSRYFSRRANSVFSSLFAYLCLVQWFSSIPFSRQAAYLFPYSCLFSSEKQLFPSSFCFLRSLFISHNRSDSSFDHWFPVSSVFFFRYLRICTLHSAWSVPYWYSAVSWSCNSVPA